MLSAFGIEHGEVEKAFRAPRVKIVRPPKRGVVHPPGHPAHGQGGPAQAKGMLHRIGSADISLKGIGEAAGRGLKGAGNFMERRPGLTGTALVGGGGAAGYKYFGPKRKKGS